MGYRKAKSRKTCCKNNQMYLFWTGDSHFVGSSFWFLFNKFISNDIRPADNNFECPRPIRTSRYDLWIGRGCFCLEGPDMTVFVECSKWDTKIQTASNQSRKRKKQAIRTRMSHFVSTMKFSSIWHCVRFFNVQWGLLVSKKLIYQATLAWNALSEGRAFR